MQQQLQESIDEFSSNFPNQWEVFVTEAPKRANFIFPREESAKWFITLKDRRQGYIDAGALRKIGVSWFWNPQRFIRTWEQLNIPGES